MWSDFWGALAKLVIFYGHQISCLKNKGHNISFLCLTFPDFKLAEAKELSMCYFVGFFSFGN